MPIDIGLDDKACHASSEAIARTLADTSLAYVKTRGFHWNVTGPNFLSLHQLFEQQYLELALKSDELAERMRALGHLAPGSSAALAKGARLVEQSSVPSWKDMVRELATDRAALDRYAREASLVAEKVGDIETHDMLIAHATDHGKAAWMLRSHLE